MSFQTVLRWLKQSLIQSLNSQIDLYLALWGVCSVDLGESWLRYNGPALYIEK